jgi:hypothetical protein
MWDLAIPGGNDHDFYIVTIAAAVLVHNCPDRVDPPKWKRCIDNVLAALHTVHGYGEPDTMISRLTEITSVIQETKKPSTSAQGPGDGDDDCGS